MNTLRREFEVIAFAYALERVHGRAPFFALYIALRGYCKTYALCA